MPESGVFDIIVVGGGAVGLHAALKAAVLRHSVLVIDKGRAFARVAQAPAIANIPGNPGISGDELLDRLRKDLGAFARLSGEQLVTFADGAEAVAARREERGAFVVTLRDADGAEREARGRVLVLATGLVDRKPGIGAFHRRGHATLAPFIHQGGVGYCLLCEGWDLRDRRVGVVGCSGESVQIAHDIARHFGGDVVLLTDGVGLEDERAARALEDARGRVERRAVESYGEGDDGIEVRFAEGAPLRVDKLLFTLGQYRVNNELAVMLGAATTPEGYVKTDGNSEAVDQEGNRIPGLFAVGDVRAGRWKQVVVGWGDAETAIITAYAKRLPDE